MPVSLKDLAGCKAGKALICCNTSGEALIKTQSWLLLEMAMEDWVRAR